MNTYQIRKGRDITIVGEALKETVDIALPKNVAVQPFDFRGLKLRLISKENDAVKVGSTILTDKINPDIKIVSPVSGKVVAINRGEKRSLLEVVIESDGKQEKEIFQLFSEDELKSVKREEVVKALLNGGLWPIIRQRPFSKIANPLDTPKSVFIHAMNTEPLAGDVDFILEGKEKEFQAGLDIINKLTEGDVHLCYATGTKSKALHDAKNVKSHRFFGPHPAGNVSTHIHSVDPINKGDIVWWIEAQDVIRVADLFLKGTYPVQRVVALTGAGVKNRVYANVTIGSPISNLLQGSDLNGVRCISGSILVGKTVSSSGYLSFYDSQVTVIPEGGNRELIGWLLPGANKYTFTKTFLSAFLPKKDMSLDSDTNGSPRAIVLNHLYDDLVPLDIMTYFLIRAVVSGDIEESEKLGILECDEEDFALCTFACPSKTDVGGIIREGLELIEREG